MAEPASYMHSRFEIKLCSPTRHHGAACRVSPGAPISVSLFSLQTKRRTAMNTRIHGSSWSGVHGYPQRYEAWGDILLKSFLG